MNTVINIIKVIAVIIGTIIGAGFASGKEIYIFFAKYEKGGFLGAIISATLTAIIIYKTIAIVKKYNIENNNEFVEKIAHNQKIALILKNIINIFLVVSFWIMCAGFCTYFRQEFNVPIIITAVINAIIIYILLIKNLDGVIKLNTIAVPIMIIIIVIISIKNYPMTSIINSKVYISNGNAGKAILSSVLYTSYNSITLIPIIISLASNIKDKNTSKIATAATGGIIFILIISIFKMLILCRTDVSSVEFPILRILDECSNTEKIIYSIAIVTAILTSAISAGYGVLENIEDKQKYKKIAKLICILEIPIYYIGFGNLVSALYPAFGVIGIIQIISILKKDNSIAKNSKN